jgi:hypothetical protein
MRSNSWSFSDISYQAVSSMEIFNTVALLHYYSNKLTKNNYMNVFGSEKDTIEYGFGQFGMVYEDDSCLKYKANPRKIDIIVTNFV